MPPKKSKVEELSDSDEESIKLTDVDTDVEVLSEAETEIDEKEEDEDDIIHTFIEESTDTNVIHYETLENRITSDTISAFELTEVISVRSSHIANGSPVYTDVTNCPTSRDKAVKEILDKKSPLSVVRRDHTRRVQEIWSVNELTILHMDKLKPSTT